MEKHPPPEDFFLIIEIADPTPGHARFSKGLAYPKTDIRQYLVLNIQEKLSKITAKRKRRKEKLDAIK